MTEARTAFLAEDSLGLLPRCCPDDGDGFDPLCRLCLLLANTGEHVPALQIQLTDYTGGR